MGDERYVEVSILAQDPSVLRDRDRAVTTKVRIPREAWLLGPRGSRVQIVDYDVTTDTTYECFPDGDWLANLHDEPTADHLGSHHYHACNLFATAVATIADYERALGRRVGFATDTHQIKLAPHAFLGRNAYYQRGAEAVAFGYFRGRNGGWVDTCLSYDIIVHELSHAVLDGLRPRFVDPSSPQQSAFHEAFADIVALLSSLARRELVEWMLGRQLEERARDARAASRADIFAVLDESDLMGIAPQVGTELDGRRRALRNSLVVARSGSSSTDPHRLGEQLVGAMLIAFRELLRARLDRLLPGEDQHTSVALVAAEAARCADLLKTLCIQALDYTPPVHITFPDYLSALLTVYAEFHETADGVDAGEVLLDSFRSVGIDPVVDAGGSGKSWRDHRYHRFDAAEHPVNYDHVRLEQIQTDRDEAFRFVFANHEAFDLDEDAYTRVLSVRPAVRVSPEDGFTVRETVIECLQRLQPTGAELKCILKNKKKLRDGRTGAREVIDMLDETATYDLRGGSTIVLGDNGQVKYSIRKHLIPNRNLNRISDYVRARQQRSRSGGFARLHRGRRPPDERLAQEAWT